MKTKNLIKYLQEQDPSGEMEALVGNHDIYFAETMPAYYDGMGQVLIRDESKPGYNIVGAKFISGGSKVSLHVMSIRDAIDENPDLPVDLSETGSRLDEYKATVKQWRAESRQTIKEAEEWMTKHHEQKAGEEDK